MARLDRWIATLLLTATLLALSGCGISRGSDAGPTATSPPPLSGQALQPLEAGRDVLAPDGRYSLRVPSDWLTANAPVAEVSYRSPDLASSTSFTVVRENLTSIQRPQAYAEAARREITSQYRNVLTISLAPVRVGNHEAYRWIYTATRGSEDFYFYQLFVIDGGEGFVLTGLAPVTSDFATTQATFDAIAGTMLFARG